jgi:prepilin-type N-terminal cleavage/methylation domain-containing protein
MKERRQGGFTLVEMVVVVAILLVLAAIAVPSVRAHSATAQILSAGRQFRAEFQRARFAAIHTGRHHALRFETCDFGPCYSVYRDGDMDGIRAEDIEAGCDLRVTGPMPLTGKATRVRVGINNGVQEIPPERGLLEGDPIRFGRSRMISFSPLGGATPGTFYLAGDATQGAVRVTGSGGRVRLLIWHGTWQERP